MSSENGKVSWKDLDGKLDKQKEDIKDLLDLKLESIGKDIKALANGVQKVCGLSKSNEKRLDTAEKQIVVLEERKQIEVKRGELKIKKWQVWLVFVGVVITAVAAIVAAMIKGG